MAAEAAARQRNLDLISEHRTKIDDALDKLSSDPADKIAKVNKELEATKTRLDALRQTDGSNAAPIDAAIAQAETLARKQIEAIEKPALEAATRAAQANQKVMDDLQKQISNMGNKRQAFVDQAVGRLSEQASAAQKQQAASLAAQIFDSQAYREGQKVVDDLNNQMLRLTMDKRTAFVQDALSRMSDGATVAQRAEVEKLAAALYDQGEAQERLNKLKAEGEQITNATRTATEIYAQEIAKLKELLDAGAISQEVYNRAVANAEKQQLAARKDAQAGAIRAFNAYREQGEDAAAAVEKAFTDAMGATEDAIVNLVMSGGDGLKSLADLANSVVAEITRMAVKQAITGPLFSAIGGSMGGGGGGFLDSIFGMLFHEGGTVGEGLPKRRAVPAHVFIGAPRYHGGGIAGLKPGEIPAILERGETVLPKNQKMGGASTIIMNISTPDANSFRSSQAQIAADAVRGIDRARRNL
jgi:lambda family phage tail tape measure protein